ncbi:hypothetical protein [Kutzneria sp. NPDC052558]|uniref:hypothetical protein n=1 Tax=Kutzneria sp. NPDC052558 TaxID=3364121 RepID=UPI0037CA7876
MTPQTHRHRSMIATLLVALLVALAGCSGDPAPPPALPTTTSATGEPGFLISYAAAASRLDGMDADTAQEQIRDWATLALASYLDIDAPRLRAATFDTLPVRDPGLADLARQPSGPGRSLYDGKGVLHLLVQRDDPHRARTIGLLLDQYRTDAGSDPAQVQVHDYRIVSDQRMVAVAIGKPGPTAKVREANGYVSMRVDTADGLTGFLDKTRNFSGLEVRGSQVWANGWNWPDVPAAPVTAADVSVLQRGYAATTGPLPGFSLDPGPKLTAADVHAIVPDLSSDLADAVAAGANSPAVDKLRTTVWNALFNGGQPPPGLSPDRTRLWALYNMIVDYPAYSQARFDGPLAGTEVGMTLMYDDFEAKQWSNGVGDSVPSKAVPGFVAAPDAATPWGQCVNDAVSESGRLWFGQDQAGFAFASNRVDIGARATRLFAKANSDSGEVQPSYSFGRGLTWWDQHFQAVADYEPQYERLDQIMRWSGALEWLVAKAGKRLPEAGGPADAGLRFADWYARNNQLKERSGITFVSPPSATQEALLPNASRTFTDCGFAVVAGGVELSDGISLQGNGNYQASLPPSVRRAGPVDPDSSYDNATGAGHLKQESINSESKVDSYRDYVFSPVSDGKAGVEITAPGRKVAALGDFKVNVSESVPRTAKTEISVRDGAVSEQISLQGQDFGTVTAARGHGTIVVAWNPGPVASAVTTLDELQRHWGAPLDSDTVVTRDVNGQTEYRTGALDDPWLLVTADAPAGEDLTFRLGKPGKVGEPTQFAEGVLRGPPDLGGPDQFEAITPAKDGQPPRIDPVGSPDSQARSIQFDTPAGGGFKAYEGDDGRLVVKHADLAHDPAAVAAVAKMPDIAKSMQEAANAHDGHYRVVALGGEGVALAGVNRVFVAAMNDIVAADVFRMISLSRAPPLVDLAGPDALYVGPEALKVDPRAERKQMTMQDVVGQHDSEVYLAESARTTLHLREGRITADELPRDTRVIVVQAQSPVLAAVPEILDYRQTHWQLVGSGGGNPPDVSRWLQTPTIQTTPSPTPTTTPTSGGPNPATARTVLLVCADTTPPARECQP